MSLFPFTVLSALFCSLLFHLLLLLPRWLNARVENQDSEFDYCELTWPYLKKINSIIQSRKVNPKSFVASNELTFRCNDLYD